MYAEHCISIKTRKKRKLHDVHTECTDFLVLAAPGTPWIDAYLNLQLVRRDPSGREFEIPTTVFIRYKLTSANTQAPHLKVSTMNSHAKILAETLGKMAWDNSQNWLILWVSNRPILENVIPHSRLRWVGKDNLEQHAPLIARRGLVIKEQHADAMVIS